jgi:hypothetical protein
MAARFSIIVSVAVGLFGSVDFQRALARISPPSKAETDTVVTELKSTDSSQIDTAVKQIHDWITAGTVSQDLWRTWLPQLVKDNRNQNVADLALAGIMGRPGPEAITPLLEFRINALLALNQNDDALAAAKSYYNVCDLKYTAHAIDLVGLCLARTHPDDPEIVRRWKAEQSAASTSSPQAAATGSPQAAGSNTSATTQPSGMLSEVKVDSSLYDAAIQTWLGKNKRIADRICYGDLLLAADKSADAEKLFKECYQLATTPDELAKSTEGIAKSLRAEDGNIGRANAWLAALQQAAAATQPTAGAQPAAATPAVAQP